MYWTQDKSSPRTERLHRALDTKEINVALFELIYKSRSFFIPFKMTMLCPMALKSLLDQANTRGVDSTLLINKDGSMLVHSGNTTDRHAMITAAVASNVWGVYERAGRAANLTVSPAKTPTRRGNISESEKESSLHHIILNCEEGRAGVAVVPGTEYIVCVFADPSCELGLLKKKLVALVDYLKEPLNQLSSDQHGLN